MHDNEKYGTLKRTRGVFGSFRKLASKVTGDNAVAPAGVASLQKAPSSPVLTRSASLHQYGNKKYVHDVQLPATDAQGSLRKPLYGSVRRLQRTTSATIEHTHNKNLGAGADCISLHDFQITASVLKKSVSVPYTQYHTGRIDEGGRASLASSNASSATWASGSLSSTDDLRNGDQDLFKNVPPSSSSSSDATSVSSPSPESVRRLNPAHAASTVPLITPPTRNMYACSAPGCSESFSRFFQLKNHTVQVHGVTGMGTLLKTNIEHGYKQERSELVERAELAMVQEVVIEGSIV